MNPYLIAALLGAFFGFLINSDSSPDGVLLGTIAGAILGFIALFLFNKATEFFFDARKRMKDQDRM